MAGINIKDSEALEVLNTRIMMFAAIDRFFITLAS